MTDKERFEEKTTSYLRELATRSVAVRDMYFYNPEYENIPIDTTRDILLEKANTKVKGLVHKFRSRAFILLSYTCAANCRFCERQDRVGVGLDKQGLLRESDIRDAIAYIEADKGINEVIFSGGDPLTNPKGLEFACNLLESVNHVKIIRIHTKLPMQYPEKVDVGLIERIANLSKTVYVSVHVNHPDELNEVTIPLMKRIRRAGAIMLSQSVFLKGVNDKVDVLHSLFTTLSEIGVRPYYIYHCSKIPTTGRFVMAIEDEIRIMTDLRERLSGIAYPTHAIDLMGAIGKAIIPTNHWDFNPAIVRDYMGRQITLDDF
jgi:lysine 2,3-aminomutase